MLDVVNGVIGSCKVSACAVCKGARAASRTGGFEGGMLEVVNGVAGYCRVSTCAVSKAS